MTQLCWVVVLEIDVFLGAGPTWHGAHGVNVVSPILKL
jgi:hypothetical protein